MHCAFGHAHRADQIGHCGDVLARLAVDLVHRPARGDESGKASGPQPLDRPRNEIIVEREAQLSGWIVGAHRPVRERRIADREVEEFRQFRLGEILVANAGVRVEEFGDPGGNVGSISTPVSASLPARASEERAKNRPVPQPGSRTRPPSKPIRRSVRQMARIMNSGV